MNILTTRCETFLFFFGFVVLLILCFFSRFLSFYIWTISEQGFNDQQMSMLANTEKIAEEREREIIQIAQSINDLAQIFKEMHMMVIDQGTILDRIDYNIEKVVTYTDEAVEELTKVSAGTRFSRWKKQTTLPTIFSPPSLPGREVPEELPQEVVHSGLDCGCGRAYPLLDCHKEHHHRPATRPSRK